MLPDLVQQAQANLPAGRIKTLAYDKAADDEDVHDLLHDEGIEPLIQNRALWKTEPETAAPRPRWHVEHRLRRSRHRVLL